MVALPTKVLPQHVLDAVKRSRPVYTAGRRARFAIGSRLGARAVPGIDGRAHYNDFMLTSTEPQFVESYVTGARQFVGILERALREAGRDWASVEACLEVGCGYGRIVRELRSRLSPSKIYVSDVIDEGARFTAAEFGVSKIPTLENAGAPFDGAFDLVYLLSVYTHLRRDMVEANLKAVAHKLKPGGLAVFTIHGMGSATTAERYRQYWLDKDTLLAALKRDGYYYERYPYYYAEYGLTWFTPEAVAKLVEAVAPQLKRIAYHPVGLDQHQDVYVFRKD